MVSRPRVRSMRKKMIAQKGDRGSLVKASGYTTNAMPGPDTDTHTLMRMPTHTIPTVYKETIRVIRVTVFQWAVPAWCCHCIGVLPSSATCSMGTFNSCAMKPMTEKMTNPANMLVALFIHVTITVSLQVSKREMLNKQTSPLVAEIIKQYFETWYIWLVS